MRLWVLQWQRKSLALQSGCRPEKIVSNEALGYAAHKLVFPEDAHAPEELERLLRHFCHEQTHNADAGGI